MLPNQTMNLVTVLLRKRGSFGCSSSMEANTAARTQYPLVKLEIINQSPVSAFNQPIIKPKKSSSYVHSTEQNASRILRYFS